MEFRFIDKAKNAIAKCGVEDIKTYEEYLSMLCEGCEYSFDWELKALREAPMSSNAIASLNKVFKRYNYMFQGYSKERLNTMLSDIYTFESIIIIAIEAANAYLKRYDIKPVYSYLEEPDKGISYYVINHELVILPIEGCYPNDLSGKLQRIARNQMVTNYHPINNEDVIAITDMIASLIPCGEVL